MAGVPYTVVPQVITDGVALVMFTNLAFQGGHYAVYTFLRPKVLGNHLSVDVDLATLGCI